MKKKIEVDSFLQFQFVGNPSFSPDGKKLYNIEKPFRSTRTQLTVYQTSRKNTTTSRIPTARFGNRTPMEVRMAALNSDKPGLYPIPENKRIQKYKAKFAA